MFKLREPLRRDSEQRKESCSGAKTPLSEIAGHVDGRVKTLVLRSANVVECHLKAVAGSGFVPVVANLVILGIGPEGTSRLQEPATGSVTRDINN